jgi:Glutaminase
VRSLTGFLSIPIFAFIFAVATGAFAPSLSFAQDPSKPECLPPAMPPIFPSMTYLSELTATLAQSVKSPTPALSHLSEITPEYTPHLFGNGPKKGPNLINWDKQFLVEPVVTPKVNLDFLGNKFIAASVLTPAQLSKVFNQLAQDKLIPFKYPEDGCYARAEEMSRLLEKDGIISVKVFIAGNLHVATKNSAAGSVNWVYHVAPAVLIEENGKYIPMVIDPSLFDKAVSLDDWAKIQTVLDPNYKIYFRDRYTYQAGAPAQDDQPEFRNADLVDAIKVMNTFRSKIKE